MWDTDLLSQLEGSLWEAADQLRANSGLGSNEYFFPVMGIIFLRHAYNRFTTVNDDIGKDMPKRGGVARPLTKEDFLRRGSLFLRKESQFNYLLELETGKDVGSAINKAMELIENDYENLKGILPKEYQSLENSLLVRILKIFNAEALRNAKGDVFGHIYEYFLMKFAIEKAHDNGEFFTPVSLVQTIVNVIEPSHGIVLDPACGSGGMFVQTSHFIQNTGLETQKAVTFYGQEKTATTIRLAKMNLAVHGLEGKIDEGNTFYMDRHELLGKADIVMANPPFNVDSVDADKVKGDPRLPFGLPGVNKKDEVSNGNYLWISYFYSYLNKTGRAGFVMSSQASSAGNDEKEVRRKIVETGHVDVMISIRSNFFYTRTVPCELWFFDKGKPAIHKDKVLMLDARSVFHVVNRKIYDFTQEQLSNITAIVWLYRGQNDRFLNLVKSYLERSLSEALKIENEIEGFKKGFDSLMDAMKSFSGNADCPVGNCAKSFRSRVNKLSSGQTLGDPGMKKTSPLAEPKKELDESFDSFQSDCRKLFKNISEYKSILTGKMPSDNKKQKSTSADFEQISEACHDLIKQTDLIYKLAVRVIDVSEKECNASESDNWEGRKINGLRKALDELRKKAVEQLKITAYFQKQVHWLQSRFRDAKFADVEGLCKLVSKKDIEANDWSLTPGRYVGVAPEEVDEDFDFEETLRTIHVELADLNEEAAKLANTIQKNFEELGI
jgi:type I restriction enzyme M protein